MDFSQSIAERVIGQYPLSIATSLAMESICGIHPEKPVSKPPILVYPQIWININTLYRNFMGSLEKSAATAVGPMDIAQSLFVEMDSIEAIIKDLTSDKTKVFFYYCKYKDIDKKYKHAIFRTDNTQKQIEYSLTRVKTMMILLKYHPERFQIFDLKIHPQGIPPKALIMTHNAYDLLSAKFFSQLTLLESHTGNIKEKGQFYTKYCDGKNLIQIPFREDLIQVFGDNEIFKPMSSRIRNELLEIATKYKWSQVTTRDRIYEGISRMQDHETRALLKSILV
jgi:hypothetical protein